MAILSIQKDSQEYKDLCLLREAKEAEMDAPAIGISEVKKRLAKRTKNSPGSGNKQSSR
jgi:hypothetical protein